MASFARCPLCSLSSPPLPFRSCTSAGTASPPQPLPSPMSSCSRLGPPKVSNACTAPSSHWRRSSKATSSSSTPSARTPSPLAPRSRSSGEPKGLMRATFQGPLKRNARQSINSFFVIGELITVEKYKVLLNIHRTEKWSSARLSRTISSVFWVCHLCLKWKWWTFDTWTLSYTEVNGVAFLYKRVFCNSIHWQFLSRHQLKLT